MSRLTRVFLAFTVNKGCDLKPALDDGRVSQAQAFDMIQESQGISPNPTSSGPRSTDKRSFQFIVGREEIIVEYSGKERGQSPGVWTERK